MSRKDAEVDVAPNVTPESTEDNVKRFPLSSFRKNCIKTFGITTSTFDGATFRLEEKEYSLDEMKSIIEKWKKQEVK